MGAGADDVKEVGESAGPAVRCPDALGRDSEQVRSRR
jgi:hypothetical protein